LGVDGEAAVGGKRRISIFGGTQLSAKTDIEPRVTGCEQSPKPAYTWKIEAIQINP
jgi:hypothetical protein